VPSDPGERPDLQQGSAHNPDDRPLPSLPAAEPTPDIKKALNHPVRRQILCSLASSATGRSLAELTREIPRAGISVVSYHLSFLNRCGTVSVSAAPWKDGSPTWRYGSDFRIPRPRQDSNLRPAA
jgi:DNA-binding transcriptional ArsR family regulator